MLLVSYLRDSQRDNPVHCRKQLLQQCRASLLHLQADRKFNHSRFSAEQGVFLYRNVMEIHTLQTIITPVTLPQQVDVKVSQQQVKRLQVSLHVASTHSQHLETQRHFWLSFKFLAHKYWPLQTTILTFNFNLLFAAYKFISNSSLQLLANIAVATSELSNNLRNHFSKKNQTTSVAKTKRKHATVSPEP